MTMGKESVRTLCRQCSGIARRQNKGLQKLNLIWVGCITKGEESVKTMQRQCNGIARQQGKGMLLPNIIWV